MLTLLIIVDLDTSGKVKRVFMALGRGVGILVLLYLFVCSLDFLSSAFRLIGGRTTGKSNHVIYDCKRHSTMKFFYEQERYSSEVSC